MKGVTCGTTCSFEWLIDESDEDNNDDNEDDGDDDDDDDGDKDDDDDMWPRRGSTLRSEGERIGKPQRRGKPFKICLKL